MTDAITYNRTRRYFPRSTWIMIQIAIGAAADGVPGRETANKLEDYQRAVGLTPDGKFGALTQAHFAGLWHEERILTRDEAIILMEPTARHESGSKGYAAHNRDGEFKGWFDNPERNPPYFHRYSHRGEAPLHIGSSLFRIQCTQISGNAGLVISKARDNAELIGAMDEWEKALDGRGDALLRVITRDPGDWRIRIKGDVGRRAANTMPIDGYDMWEGPWIDRLKRLSQYDWLRRAADDVAYHKFFVPMLKDLERVGWVDGGSIAMMFDAAVNHGHGGMRRRLNRLQPGDDCFDFARQFGTGRTYTRRIKAHDQSPWWVTYRLEDS